MSNLPDVILQYLDSTRYILPKTTDTLDIPMNEIYKSMMDFIDILSKKFNIDANMSIVYTDSLKSEAITFDDSMHILHDQYLGQTLNMLNRLFEYDASQKTIIIYFHKIIGQIFSRYGFYEESVFASRMYQSEIKNMDHMKKQLEDSSLRHGHYTYIQELFILLHEHAHLVFKVDKNELEDHREDAIDWLNKQGNTQTDIDTLLQLLINMDLPQDELNYYEENTDKLKSQLQSSNNLYEELLDRDDLIEEFACDRLALIHMTVFFDLKEMNNTSENIKAILLGFLHMRTIQLLEARCSVEENFDFKDRNDTFKYSEKLYATFYNARLHHIKELCYNVLISSREEFEEIHVDMSKMMDAHTDKLLSPAENIIRTLLYDSSIRDSMDDDFAFIRNQLGSNQSIKRAVSALLHTFRE